jgi:hypothetical protein
MKSVRLELPVLLERGVDPGPILRSDEIQEQPAKQGQAQSHAGTDVGVAVRSGSLKSDHPIEPIVHEPGEQRCERLLASARTRVTLEEETFSRPQTWIAQTLPHRVRQLLGRRLERLEQPALVLFDFADYLRKEAVARTEVMDEHPVTRADRRGNIAQGTIADPAALQLGHDRIEDFLLSDVQSVPFGTCTRWYSQLRGPKMKARVWAERAMSVPAEVVYHCLADYREHHRPDGFLPPAFSDFEIAEGGVGAGTRLRWVVDVGGRRRTVSATVTEPEPGRRLVESAAGLQTTFSVEPTQRGALVRFDTVLDEAGIQGILNRLFAARILRPIYEDELRKLEAYARHHEAIAS